MLYHKDFAKTIPSNTKPENQQEDVFSERFLRFCVGRS